MADLFRFGGAETRSAWERFQAGERLPEELRVRPEVLASWERSARAGADSSLDAPYFADFDRESRIVRSARPVLSRLAERLAGTDTCIFLTDPDALVLDRWMDSGGPTSRLRELGSEPGFSFSEVATGTNAGSMVADSGRPGFVVGAEHFPEELHGMSCFAAPVRDPVVGRVAGILDITCLFDDTNNLVLPMALQAAEEIGERLAADSTRRERLLLESFSRAVRKSSHPLVSINESTLIANPAGTRFLREVDHAVLWEQVSRAVRDRAEGTHEFALRGGDAVLARCRPVYDGGEISGVLVHLAPVPNSAPGPASTSSARLPGLVGRSAAWLEAVERALNVARDVRPVLVTGPPGSGRSTMARAVHDIAAGAEKAIQEIDCSTNDAVDDAVARLRVATGPTILNALERVPARQGAELAAAIAAAVSTGTKVVGIHTGPVGGDVNPALEAFPGTWIAMPPLRDRLDDLPDLARHFARRLGGSLVQIDDQALRAMLGFDWDGNLAQLEAVLRTALSRCRGRTRIRLDDLPEEIVTSSVPAHLTAMERVELDALRKALRTAEGSKTRAAETLGISRSTLYRKIKRYRLDPDRHLY